MKVRHDTSMLRKNRPFSVLQHQAQFDLNLALEEGKGGAGIERKGESGGSVHPMYVRVVNRLTSGQNFYNRPHRRGGFSRGKVYVTPASW